MVCKVKRFSAWKWLGLGLACGELAAAAVAITVTFDPELPGPDDVVTISIADAPRGGHLHWGVNARGHNWTVAIPPYHPPGSYTDGIATRTPLQGPDTAGVCRVQLGPFNHPSQSVASIDFAILWNDGAWDSRDGQDYHLPISRGRITFTPRRPTVNDPIYVRVHQSAPGGFLHWGVNAVRGQWKMPRREYWPPGSVAFPDGVSVETPLPPPDAAGMATVVLGPFDHPGQFVTGLQAVVHWGTNWDVNLGRNYNLAIRPAAPDTAPTLAIRAPAPGQELTTNSVVTVELAGADTAEVWLDDQPLTTLSNSPWTAPLPAAALPWGRHVVTARAGAPGRRALTQADFWRVPEFTRGPTPAATAFGATVGPSNMVTFALYAPGKHFVTVIGDFNRWQAEADPLNLAPDGTWWLTRAIKPGRHLYQYMIDGELKLADPYARDVEWRDARDRETAATEMARAVLEVPDRPFNWTDADYQRPPLDQLLIYEFSIPDLHPGRDFNGTIEKLDYIRDLGVNAIEPLPFNEFPGAVSWGYNPAFHFAPETALGTPAQLKRLVDRAHRRGLAVIMDMVLNHMDWNSPLFQLYQGDYDANPYFRLFTGENWGFPDLDQRADATRRYTADLLRFWIMDYHIDGFRYDATRWVEWQGYNDWGASWFAYAAKQADPAAYQIAEHLPSDPELTRRSEMDSQWNDYFRWKLRDMLLRAGLNRYEFEQIMDPRRIGFDHASERVAYIESHDEERYMHDLLGAGWDVTNALRRALSAAAVVLTAPGIAMIYAGQEFGEDTPKNVGPNPLRWEKLKQPAYRAFHERFKALCRLRTSHPALWSGEIRFRQTGLPDGVAVYERGNPAHPVVVAINFDRRNYSFPLPLPTRAWSNVLEQTAGSTTNGAPLVLTLPGGGAAVLVTSDPPPADL